MPKISVVMPVYNTKEEYFREAIESILNQSFDDIELIIVDDCSELYIQKIVNSYSDNRIKYYKFDKNHGAADARNFAISKSRSKYIAFMDSDDVSLSNRLEVQYNFLEQNHQIGCLGTGVEGIGAEWEKVKFHTFSSSFEIELFLIFNGCAFCQSSVMIRKSILIDNDIKYKTQYVPAEDYGLWLDLVGYTQFYVLPKTLIQYRYYPENISHRQSDLQRKNSGLAQFNAFQKYCNVKFQHPETWINFISANPVGKEELAELECKIPYLINILQQKGCPKKDLMYFFKKKFKRIFYKTKTFRGQWSLFNSNLNKFFRVSYRWRLMCLITRGVL